MTDESSKMTYAEKWKAGADKSKAELNPRSPEEAAEKRGEKFAKFFSKGAEIYNNGMNFVKEKVQNAGKYAKEGGKWLLGTPERVAGAVDSGKVWVKEKVADGALAIDKANDWCADQWDSATAKATGAVESGVRNVGASITEAGANFSNWRKEANAKNKEKGHLILRKSLEAAKNLVAYLQTKLEGAQGNDQAKVDAWEESRSELQGGADDLRKEAAERKNNGHALKGLRDRISGVIAPTRF